MCNKCDLCSNVLCRKATQINGHFSVSICTEFNRKSCKNCGQGKCGRVGSEKGICKMWKPLGHLC